MPKLNIFYGTKYLGWLASQWLAEIAPLSKYSSWQRQHTMQASEISESTGRMWRCETVGRHQTMPAQDHWSQGKGGRLTILTKYSSGERSCNALFIRVSSPLGMHQVLRDIRSDSTRASVSIS